MIAFGASEHVFVGRVAEGKRVGEGLLINTATRTIERQLWKEGEEPINFPRTAPEPAQEDEKEL